MKVYELTGDFYYKKTFFGMILYVEVYTKISNAEGPWGLWDFIETRFKRANEHDATKLMKLLLKKK